jgi:hypothetical protein
MILNVWYVPTFKKSLLPLTMIRQVGHEITMEDGLFKINSIKQNFKTNMIGYLDGNRLRMKGKVIPRKHNFAGQLIQKIHQ